MVSVSLLFGAWLVAAMPAVETRFEQLAPANATAADTDAVPRRRPDMRRAVILLHGLRPQPVSADAAARAQPSTWEKPQGPIVKALSPSADVYAFHYAQTVALDEVARLPALAGAVKSLRAAGYEEVVLVGYSAGGVIARIFVEDTPNSGVTKVVQVCAPNAGSDWTVLSKGVRAVQVPFVRSLTREDRVAAAKARAGKSIPPQVEFVCIVTAMNWLNDGVVRRDAQWTPELQAQGVPAELVFSAHVGAMYSNRMANRIAELVTTPQPRWSHERIVAARPKVLGLTSAFAKPPAEDTGDALIRVEAREKLPPR
jgi:triacylglycerol esterase/lipase EstA (alpha/beta hydrolase family)